VLRPHGAGWAVVFDQQLQEVIGTPANYPVTYALNDKVVTSAATVGNELRTGGAADISFTPPDGIAYLGAPAELFGISGLPVAPFAKVPFV